MKSVLRRAPLLDRSRAETNAEHSWQIALMAVLTVTFVLPADPHVLGVACRA